ncbi:oxidase [Streptomyces cinereoruber]|uniref:Oxidase n=1 Tax=Streptomyces cinereoruber TaxID=67260 RepID=A0AAV4KQI2_9ACTN|nr:MULTISPECIES: pyridoxal 5'-phosphate synthase [Streptomyces]AVH96953.1 pyridoxal 5'-phosphate synthase [Streptomyces sp. WAC00288]KYG55563.1 oxidase [Streptomyces sp. WAC04657]MBB4160019.1 pyridoxamine 5'-phosphate oxidase [Streptomyces cinereoruber]MBY8818369.1 pyridoxal 5'-phosphate synthase [Streptomyces cinereoruber]NIH60957.1 pyridoxamine 5'-phosphate oxidase [Streptomyces cinereoruber]
MTTDFDRALRSLRVWDTALPAFDPAGAPPGPLALFHDWFTAAVAAGQSEPHTPFLATADEDGRPDVRVVMLHGADARGWHFASHSTSAKGRQLAARPEAALGFYWPVQGRQVRVRGRVATGTPEEAYEDLHARTTGALAAALVGRQSEVLDSPETLAEASAAAWHRAEAEPDAPAPTWTPYTVEPDEVEFFQGDERRRHVRLRYRRDPSSPDGWTRELLWP